MASLAGLALAIVLLVVGILFQQNANFAHDNVKNQLAEQKVFFPPANALSAEEKASSDVVKYAGKQVTNGKMAEVYANDYIAVHLKGIAGGKTYSETSEASRANPDDQKLAQQVQTLFRGETLRGLLLTSYAFGTLGDKASQMATVMFIGAAVFFVLAILGLLHYRRTPHTAELDV